MVQSGYIAPLPLNAFDGKITLQGPLYSTTVLSGLEPITIYDYFIVGRDYTFAKLAKDIQLFGRQNINVLDFLKRFEQSGKPFTAAKNAYKESTRGQNTLFFVATNNTRIPIYTPTTFDQGSSLSHITTSVETLMYPFVRNGVTLENLMARLGGTNIYGNSIQIMLETMGWPSPGNATVKSVALALGYDGSVPSASNFVAPIWALLLVNLIFIL